MYSIDYVSNSSNLFSNVNAIIKRYFFCYDCIKWLRFDNVIYKWTCVNNNTYVPLILFFPLSLFVYRGSDVLGFASSLHLPLQTFPYEWKILEWDDKPKQTNRKNRAFRSLNFAMNFLVSYLTLWF